MGSISHRWVVGVTAGALTLLGATYLLNKELRHWRRLERCMQQVDASSFSLKHTFHDEVNSEISVWRVQVSC